MIIKLIPLLLITVKIARCSLVIDGVAQEGVYVSDYCPSMEYCKEGTHVMCMYYDPHHPIGPRCSNFENITVTTELANQLLDITNAIRSKIANGNEVGHDGVPLPRGYGIYRLKWDNELATFAQVFANQCMLRHDLCRATKRFPDADQSAGKVIFTYPDWFPTGLKQQRTPGLSQVKLVYAINQIMKSWYAGKTNVTEQMIRSYPDLKPNQVPHNQALMLYTKMIYGSTTHMGCGMSAYTEYNYFNSHKNNVYNTILVICNYSARPTKGNPVYAMDPPRGDYSECGCPIGTKADIDCLCNEDPKSISEGSVFLQPQTSKTCNIGDENGNCEPTLVLLPIFTVEDAPSRQLWEQAQAIREPLKNFILERFDNSSSDARVRRQSMEVFDLLNEAERESLFHKPPPMPHPLKTVLMSSSPARDLASVPQLVLPTLPSHSTPPLLPRPHHPSPPPHPPPPPPPHSRHSTVISSPSPPYLEYTEVWRADYNNPTHAEQDETKRKPQKYRHTPRHSPLTKKSSIFTRVAQFKLPGRKTLQPPVESIKRDVLPRKDFSNIHKIVDDYLKRNQERRRSDLISNQHGGNIPHEQKKANNEETTHSGDGTTETVLKQVEEKVINTDQYKQHINRSDNEKDIDGKDDNDTKLMSLLDTLEKEVKHIALDVNEKELFDAKIRKIYGSVVGKPVVILSPKEINESKKHVKHEQEPEQLDDVKFMTEESKNTTKRDEIEKKLSLIDYETLDRNRKEKVNDYNYQKKNNENIDQNIFSDIDRKNYDNFERLNKYSELEQKYMDDLDRKYNENLDRKYSENNLDQKYNDVRNKFEDRKYRENLDRKYDNLQTRNQVKYNANKDFEFREFKHNTLSSGEDVKYRNFYKYSDKTGHDPVDKNLYRGKDSERKHRDRMDPKNNKMYHMSNDFNDPLSLERRKYYQEKLENIERKLRGSRNYRHRSEQRNDRPIIRLRSNREGMQKSRSKIQADSFYMPERARFLHGF